MKSTTTTMVLALTLATWGSISAASANSKDIYVNGRLGVSRMEVEARSGNGWAKTHVLERGKRYRYRFDMVNGAGVPSGGGFDATKEIYYDRISVEVLNGKSTCHRFFATSAYEGSGASRFASEWTDTQPGSHQTLARGKEVSLDAYFEWTCSNRLVSGLTGDAAPRVSTHARESYWIRGPSVPLVPSTQEPKDLALGDSCSKNTHCASQRCDAGNGTTKTNRCIPNDGAGLGGDYCTHNNHCDTKTCKSNRCTERKALAASCTLSSECSSGRCDIAPGNPRKCIPNDGTGKRGEYCTHNNQCRPGRPCNLAPGKRHGTCG